MAIIAIALVLAACGSRSSPLDEAQPAPDQDVDPAPAEAAPTEATRLKQPRSVQLGTRERLSRSASDVRLEQLPNGTRRLNLQGRLHQATVARLTEDGRLERGCVDTPRALDRWMTETSASAQHEPTQQDQSAGQDQGTSP